MRIRRPWLSTGLAAVALAAVGVGGTALAASESPAISEHAEREGEGDSGEGAAEDGAEGLDTPITDGDALTAASAAALAWLENEHGLTGDVTDTEVGDEESYYEIEVRLDDGRQVDVQLDERFEVLGLD